MSDRALAEGCVFSQASTTSVKVGPGLLRVGGTLLASNTDTTLALGTLANSTQYAIYAYSNAGVRTLEKSTDVPEWDAALRYWKKTGDASRRRVGWVRSGATGTMIRFTTPPTRMSHEREIWWEYDSAQASVDWLVIPGSPPAAGTDWNEFNLAGKVPADATHYALTLFGGDGGSGAGFNFGLSSGNWNTEGSAWAALWQYGFPATTGGQFNITTPLLALSGLTQYWQLADQLGTEPPAQFVFGGPQGFAYEL